jgi:hypothetical protein
MPDPDKDFLVRVVRAHLGPSVADSRSASTVVEAFLDRLSVGDSLAIDQLLNTVFLMTGEQAPKVSDREAVQSLLLRELSRP